MRREVRPMIKMMKKLFAGMNNFDFDFDSERYDARSDCIYAHGTLDENSCIRCGHVVFSRNYCTNFKLLPVKTSWYWQAVLPLAPAPPGIMQRSRRKMFYTDRISFVANMIL